MPLISVVNCSLKYLTEELKLSFRSRLTEYLYARYLDGFTYYWLTNIDQRIANPDQVLTQDVDRFCNSIVDLYSTSCKSLFDVILYVRFLGQTMGFGGPGRVLSYLFFSGLFLTRLRRPIAQLTVREQALEGQFRFVNSRLISSSEEVAFYDGAKRERETIMGCFSSLIDHLRSLLHFRTGIRFVDHMTAKYMATVVGYWAISRPFLDLNNERFLNSTHDQRLQSYYESGRVMYKMADVTGRIVMTGREIARLSGFTERICGLIETLEEVRAGNFQRNKSITNPLTKIDEEMLKEKESDSKESDTLAQALPTSVSSPTKNSASSASKVDISVSDDGLIRFKRIRLSTPDGNCLVPDLSFEVHKGQNVLVSGPNGCGKSSLFRVLCGLWPAVSATSANFDDEKPAQLVKPHRGNLFYVPQKFYFCAGTLRDQIIYPDSVACMKKKSISDDELVPLLDAVQLTYILEREGGFDAVKHWSDVFSVGEKQRIAMARLFYRRPQFAVLDECTSAVSVDVEDSIYTHCRQLGITLFTVSHRKSLWKHHDFILMLDGHGAFDFRPITEYTGTV